MVERRQVLDDLCSWTHAGRNHDQVEGLVLVGSGASGFRDAWSDLDVVVATTPDAHAEVLARVRDHAAELDARAVTTWHHRDGVAVVCLLLPSGLEVDVGVWRIDLLFATRPQWRVVASRDASAGARCEEAMTTHPPLTRPQEAVWEGDDPSWQAAAAERVRERRGARPEETVGAAPADADASAG